MIDRYDFADAIATFANYRDHSLIERLRRGRVEKLTTVGASTHTHVVVRDTPRRNAKRCSH